MKKLLFLIPVIVLLAGCANTRPLATQTAVAFGVRAALNNNHNLVPAAKIGAEVLCAVADGTNANPAALVAALEAKGPWTFEEWLLLNGVVVIAVESGANASSGPAKPYLNAGCIGMRMALVGAPQDAPTERTAPPLAARVRARATTTPSPSDPKWPQMRYP